MANMNTNPRIPSLLATFAILFPAFTMLAADAPTVSHLAGQWHGQSRFTGISYVESTQKKIAAQEVETVLHISADGKVTGRIGGAELTNCVVVANRGWFGRQFHLWSDFIVRGQIVGAVAPGSESRTHPISAPFDFGGTHISGSMFVIYPVKYPYPFLNLHLSRDP